MSDNKFRWGECSVKMDSIEQRKRGTKGTGQATHSKSGSKSFHVEYSWRLHELTEGAVTTKPESLNQSCFTFMVKFPPADVGHAEFH